MNISEIKEIVGNVSHESIKHWLKISSLRHSAGNTTEFFNLLKKLITEEDITVEQLERVAREIDEYGSKRVYMGTLNNNGTIKTKAAFEKHLKSLGLNLNDSPTRAKKKPAKPTLNYICWSPDEVRINYSETHIVRRVLLAQEKIEREEVTNLITICVEPNTGFVKIFMDTPGDVHPHQGAVSGIKVTGYEMFYKKQTQELCNATELKSLDLLRVAEGILDATPSIFESRNIQLLTSYNSRTRISSRSDLTHDPVYKAGEKADGDNWVQEGLSGFWLPDASEGELHRRLFMQLSRREDMIRFDADCLASEVDYVIFRIREL